MSREKEILGIVVSWAISLVVFFVLLTIANMFLQDNTNETVQLTLQFINNNILIIVTMAVLFLIGSLFMVLRFPFDLPGPLFNAIAGVTLSSFIFKILTFFNEILEEDVFGAIISLSKVINIIVFVLVIIVGYASVLSNKAQEHKPKFKGKKSDRER